MTFDQHTIFGDFLRATAALSMEQGKMEAFIRKLGSLPMPDRIAGRDVPRDLNGLTWAQLSRLQGMKGDDAMFVPFEAILGLGREEVLRCTLFHVLQFVAFTAREVERIGKLFEKIRYEPTPDEVRAGIGKLDFGTFGTLDWWCRRMGITDHAEGEKTPWVRIYKCLEMDNKTASYEKKLRETITKKGAKRK